MARITLDALGHSYPGTRGRSPTIALKQIDQTFEDSGAYALLGPSGCGKTTLLNLISGLLTPSQGKILFDGVDVTQLPTMERQIAQVFQFPVVYDTMTVYANLAFPLRNRGMSATDIDRRVKEIAAMLDLTESLERRAAGLTADGKQKISLGRGLVRSDVNVIMFDEPLTVIDPHLKWLLRSKLKELHQQVGATMIYVTHDQTEALTFADRVVVMLDGTVVQVGTPVELFEQPQHTFVGHFIGSPGMNVLPCEVDATGAHFFGHKVNTINSALPAANAGKIEIGVRPEFVHFQQPISGTASEGIPVEIIKVHDLGRKQIVDTRHQDCLIKMVVDELQEIPAESARIQFDHHHTRLYKDGWVVS